MWASARTPDRFTRSYIETTLRHRGRSQERSLHFSEANSPWQVIPQWAEFLIKCGYIWGDTVPSRRRIGVISMPCESAAAGLVALGAMRRRLTVDGANDSISHYQRIGDWQRAMMPRRFLRHHKYKGRFRLENKDRSGLIWVRSETVDNSRISNRTN